MDFAKYHNWRRHICCTWEINKTSVNVSPNGLRELHDLLQHEFHVGRVHFMPCWKITQTLIFISPNGPWAIQSLTKKLTFPTCLSPSLVLNSRCSKMTPMVLKSGPKIVQGAPKWPQMIPMVPKSEPKIVQGLQNDPIGRPKWTWNHKIWLKIMNIATKCAWLSKTD